MERIRTKKGYGFRTPFASIGRIGDRYWIQLRVFSIDSFVFTVYDSPRKPIVKNLSLISLLNLFWWPQVFIVALVAAITVLVFTLLLKISEAIRWVSEQILFLK